jgi:hypothetical protein
MSTKLGSNNEFPKVILVEQGSTPSNPSAGDQKLFIDSADHHLKRVNSSGTVTDVESASGLADDSVTNAKLANMSADTIKGRANGAGSGDPTDLTANQASTILDGATDPFVRTSAAGAGGGGLTLLEQHTGSSSASLDFTACITSTYDEYLIEIVNLVPATDGVHLLMRMSTNAGVSYDSGANYGWALLRYTHSGSAVEGATSGANEIHLDSASGDIDNASTNGYSGSFRLCNPLSTALHTEVFGSAGYRSNFTGGAAGVAGQHGVYLSTTAVDAFQIKFNTGNIASGTIRVYGFKK